MGAITIIQVLLFLYALGSDVPHLQLAYAQGGRRKKKKKKKKKIRLCHLQRLPAASQQRRQALPLLRDACCHALVGAANANFRLCYAAPCTRNSYTRRLANNGGHAKPPCLSFL